MSLNVGKKRKDHIMVNRGMTKKTFDTKGLAYVSELSILNIDDLQKVLEWNVSNSIFVYRMSSDMFPWFTHYNFNDLPNWNTIENKLVNIGNYIKSNNIRVSFHPGPYCVLASENPDVVNKTINELNKHAEIMDIMGLDRSHQYPINIHINTTKPSREIAADRFCTNFLRLSESCKSRLTIENDDKKSQYSVKILFDHLYKKISIPIVFDQHHFNLGPDDQTMEEALTLALSTWSVKPLTHMSSPKTIEDPTAKQNAHSDYIYEKIEYFGQDFDTELECKAKDLAVIEYLRYHQS